MTLVVLGGVDVGVMACVVVLLVDAVVVVVLVVVVLVVAAATHGTLPRSVEIGPRVVPEGSLSKVMVVVTVPVRLPGRTTAASDRVGLVAGSGFGDHAPV